MSAVSDETIDTFKRGECPGCGGSAELAIHATDRHYLPGAVVTYPKHRVPPTATALGGKRYRVSGGEPAGAVKPTDPRLCQWTADNLYSLHLVAGWREGRTMLEAAS